MTATLTHNGARTRWLLAVGAWRRPAMAVLAWLWLCRHGCVLGALARERQWVTLDRLVDDLDAESAA